MNFNYKNPISPLSVLGNISVSRTDVFGTNFSVLGTGGYMEVYSLNDLYFTIPSGTTGSVEYSGNTIPIQLNIGSGSIFSPNVLTLNSDNISSGRRRIGMLVYVIKENQIYQFQIPNFENLWTGATSASGPGGSTVVFSDFGTTVKSNTSQGIAFISAWTANTIEGISGQTSVTSVWKKLNTGGSGTTFTGGTVTGPTIFTNGLSANTFSASTYFGLPIDVFVTGGTYSNGTTTFRNNTGGTFSVTGFYTGSTDVFVTGGTYSNGTATFTNNTGGTFNVTGFYTGNTDIYVTGGTFNDEILTLYRNDGNSVTITGFTDYYTTGATLINDTIYFNRNDLLSAYSVNLSAFTPNIDTFVTGFTLTGSDLILTQNNNNYPEFNVNLPFLPLSGGTLTGSLTAPTYYGDGSNLTGISRGGSGGQLYYFNISNIQSPYYELSTSATTSPEQTISATTGSNSTVLIGGFMTPSGVPNITDFPAGIISFYLHCYGENQNYTYNIYCELYKRTTGGTETLLFISDSAAVVGNSVNMVVSDGYFSGAILNTSDRLVVKIYGQNITNQTRSIYFVSQGEQHYSFALTTLPITFDTFVTGFTYSNNVFTIQQNNNQPNLTVTINSVTGLTVNGDLSVTGNTSLSNLSTTIISATTYQNLPIDVFVIGGKYSNGTATFLNNTGGTFSVTGFYTGATDVFVTGGTYSNGITTFTNNTGGTFSVTGFYTGANDVFVTGGTYSNGTATFTNNTGGTFNVTGLTTPFTGGTVTGGTNFTNGLTANTISATTYNGNGGNLTGLTKSFGITIDGGGGPILTGIKTDVIIPYNMTITGWTMVADTTGSTVVDLWMTTYSGFPPTSGNTITGSSKPTITSSNKNTSSTLIGWNTQVLSGNIIRFNVDSNSTITKLTLIITGYN